MKLQKQVDRLLYPPYRYYFGLASLPFSTVAFAFTALLAYLLYQEIRARRVSRKCYVLILNRAVGDISCSSCFILCSFYLLSVDAETFE
ncbi:unnamed protein product [Gongylonema pulchrum]|uniref:Serpentine receptor class gamma n=1 Tax=Gongylonema pulchrum TaxID=637853 RepID=A0A183D3R2_9BILA|nr:unnamed protein product [Gongylonema pulchrum]